MKRVISYLSYRNMVYKDKYIIYMDNFQMSHIKLLIYQKLVHKKTMKKDHMNQLDKYKSPYLTFPYSTLSVGWSSHNLPEAFPNSPSHTPPPLPTSLWMASSSHKECCFLIMTHEFFTSHYCYSCPCLIFSCWILSLYFRFCVYFIFASPI